MTETFTIELLSIADQADADGRITQDTKTEDLVAVLRTNNPLPYEAPEEATKEYKMVGDRISTPESCPHQYIIEKIDPDSISFTNGAILAIGKSLTINLS